MIVRNFEYTDLSGLKREEECYFNLSEAEILELQTTHEGGFVEELQRVIKMQDQAAIARLLKKFILDSYGERSADGRFFFKEDEFGHPLCRKFKASPAYDQLYVELMTNDEKASEFINGIIPASIASSKEYKEEYDRQLETFAPEKKYPAQEVIDMPQRRPAEEVAYITPAQEGIQRTQRQPVETVTYPNPEQQHEMRGDRYVAPNSGADRF